METDAQAYSGVPLTEDAERQGTLASTAAAQVAAYRARLAHAASAGRLDDVHGAQLAGDLGLAAASPSAAALVAFERALHAERIAARAWSGGKSDRSGKVLVLESLADEAAERLQVDLAYCEY